jgi:predicted O-methyltransferase YrrM
MEEQIPVGVRRAVEIGTGVGVGTEWLPRAVRDRLIGDDRLMTVDLPVSSGVIIASRLRGHRRPQ